MRIIAYTFTQTKKMEKKEELFIDVVRFKFEGMPDLILSRHHIEEEYEGSPVKAADDYGVKDDVTDAVNESMKLSDYENLSEWEG